MRYPQKATFEPGYSNNRPGGEKISFFDPPSSLIKIWPNRLSWETPQGYFTRPYNSVKVIVKPEGCRIGLESSKNHKKWSFWGRFGGPKMVLWVGTNIQKWPWAAVSTCKMCLRHCTSLILFLKCCWDHKERVRYSQCGLVTSRKRFNVKWSWNWKIRKYYFFWAVWAP